MKYNFRNSPEDIEWLRSTHLPTLPASCRSYILHGNEDAPTKVEAYDTDMPTYDQAPDFVWIVDWSLPKDKGT
jgi:hypothetical protein